jgi:superfamily II RNA helicase
MHLLDGTPEPVRSRFNMAYATLLNLYRRHSDGLLNIFPKTFYYFQTSGERRQAGLESMQRKLDLLKSMGHIQGGRLSPRGEFAAWLYGYELLLTELFIQDRLAHLNPVELAVLMTALVYEPKPHMKPPAKHRTSSQLNGLCREVLARIHREERRFRVSPLTKAPAFHLSHAMEAWMNKTPFAKLAKLSEVDEGEIVRYFRMAVQLLRQLADTPAGTVALHSSAMNALRRINRDVIDAEAQLRMG